MQAVPGRILLCCYRLVMAAFVLFLSCLSILLRTFPSLLTWSFLDIQSLAKTIFLCRSPTTWLLFLVSIHLQYSSHVLIAYLILLKANYLMLWSNLSSTPCSPYDRSLCVHGLPSWILLRWNRSIHTNNWYLFKHVMIMISISMFMGIMILFTAGCRSNVCCCLQAMRGWILLCCHRLDIYVLC
jgi:hypothetical protein